MGGSLGVQGGTEALWKFQQGERAMRNSHGVDGDRLCSAADAILLAFSEDSPFGPGMMPDPSEILDDPDCPRTLRGFTSQELVGAVDFLLRMGLVRRVH